MNETDKALIAELERFDRLIDCEGLVRLAAELYDPESGGFYYSLSARDNEGFYPDVESTAQMLVTLTSLGLFGYSERGTNRFPSEFAEGLVAFFKDRQDEESGFFFDRQFGKDVNESKKGRNTGQSVARLCEMGEEPRYPLPFERVAKDSPSEALAPHYASLDSYKKWLDDFDWESDDGHKQYYAGNMLSASLSGIRAAGFLDYTRDYLEEKQNKETGMWGKRKDSNAMNAAMKISGIYGAERKFPLVDKMIGSILGIVRKEEPYSIATLWNPLVLIRNVLRDYGEMPESTARAIDRIKLPLIRLSIDRIERFKKPDGGFSYYPDKSSKTSQGVVVSLGLCESDVNATMLGSASMRDTMFSIVRLGGHPPILKEYNSLFFELLERKRTKK